MVITEWPIRRSSLQWWTSHGTIQPYHNSTLIMLRLHWVYKWYVYHCFFIKHRICWLKLWNFYPKIFLIATTYSVSRVYAVNLIRSHPLLYNPIDPSLRSTIAATHYGRVPVSAMVVRCLMPRSFTFAQGKSKYRRLMTIWHTREWTICLP